jgi:hypothetical protein
MQFTAACNRCPVLAYPLPLLFNTIPVSGKKVHESERDCDNPMWTCLVGFIVNVVQGRRRRQERRRKKEYVNAVLAY